MTSVCTTELDPFVPPLPLNKPGQMIGDKLDKHAGGRGETIVSDSVDDDDALL